MQSVLQTVSGVAAMQSLLQTISGVWNGAVEVAAETRVKMV